MNRKLLCSTGTMVERGNNYNYPRALQNIARFMDEIGVAGCELMMLPYYYDKINEIRTELDAAGVPAVTTHCEKEVGTLFSNAAAAYSAEDKESAENYKSEGIRLFKINCEAANAFSSPRMVLHLWGGKNSDSAISYNIDLLPRLFEIASEYSLEVLVENIPCTSASPLANLRKISKSVPSCRFVFDTRFGMFHRESEETLLDPEVSPKITHVHISDFKGGATGEFKRLRPILHPGEGDGDFPMIARLLDRIGYSETINLESPVMREDASLDTDKLLSTLKYLKDIFHITK